MSFDYSNLSYITPLQWIDLNTSIAIMSAPGYFNRLVPTLKVNQIMYLFASDGEGRYKVSAIDPQVTLIAEPLTSHLDLTFNNTYIGNSAGKAEQGKIANDQVADGAGIIQSKLDNTMFRFSVSFFLDGKGTTNVWGAGQHPTAQLVGGWVQLIEAPDATGTTYTVTVQNGTGAVTMATALTFTEGVNAPPATQALAPISAGGAYNILKADALNIITGGTTTTNGQCIVTLQFLGNAT